MAAFSLAVLALGGLNAVLLALLVLRRVRLSAEARRHAALVQALRPAAVAFLQGDDTLPAGLTATEQEVLADILGEYARKLSGPARTMITRYFEEHGAVERELEALERARAAWRRAAAAHRLGDIGSSAAAAGLLAALEDEARQVRTAAARSLGKLQEPTAVEPLLAAVAARAVPRAVVGWSLLRIGPPAVPALRLLLTADDPVRRAGALRVLGLLGDAADAEAVAARLRDTSAEVRAAAAHALGRLGGSQSFPDLLAALDDRVPSVRAAAATALGRIRDRRALDALLEHAGSDRFEVAHAAARAAAAIDLEAARRAAAGPHLREAVDLAALA
jgi:HEAT repeat protein